MIVAGIPLAFGFSDKARALPAERTIGTVARVVTMVSLVAIVAGVVLGRL